MSEYSLFTSESVSAYPDKVADRISDAVLDAIIARDPHARIAVETLVKPVWPSSLASRQPAATSTLRTLPQGHRHWLQQFGCRL